MSDVPKLSVWVTSTGRYNFVKQTIDEFVKLCTYPNYEMLIIESQMTKDSLRFFSSVNRDEEKTAEYINSLPTLYPHVKFRIFIQPWKKLGAVYNQLLDMSADYYLNIEDDLVALCDPNEQIVDAIKLLQADPLLFAVRQDLRDETVYDGCTRFPVTKEAAGMKYVIWDWCSGGLQTIDVAKARQAGRFNETHEDDKYGQTEITQTEQMNALGMYIGINLKYYGFLKHIGARSIQNAPREWSVEIYEKAESRKRFGRGPDGTS